MSVTLVLDDDLDISRGDLICRPHNQPVITQDVEAMVCWMSESAALTPRSRLVVKNTTRTVKALVRDLHYRLDVNTLHRVEGVDRLVLNEIGRRHPPADPATVLRPLQPEPADRRPDPHRRGHQHHRRRRDDHRKLRQCHRALRSTKSIR